MIGFLHLADLHLGWQPGFSDKELALAIQTERDQFLAQVVDYALDSTNQIDLVVIAGDLFESHCPSQNVTGKTIKELSRLVDGGIQLVTVPGNHDEITYQESVYRQEHNRWPGFLVTNPMPRLAFQLEIKGHQVYIYSLAYTGGLTTVKPTIKDFPREAGEGFHLGIFHGSYFQGTPNWEMGARSLPLDANSLEKANYDYVALGHFHGHRVYPIGSGIGAYAGAIEDKGFNDLGTGFLLKGIWRKDGGVELEKIPVSVQPKFKKVEMNLNHINNRDELVSTIEGIGCPATLIKIELKGFRNFLFEPRWLQDRLQHAFRYLEINDQSYFLSEEELTRLSQEKTITGFFLKRMQEKLKNTTIEEEKLLLNHALAKGIWALKGGVES